MTLLDERPDTAAPTGGSGVAGRVFTTPTSSWRFASRLARREVRRRPGRTILVMLLVVVPVIGMAAGSVLYRTGRDSAEMSASRQYGTADLVLSSALPMPEFLDPAELVERPSSPDLPAGSRTTDVVTTYTNVSADIEGTVVTRAVGFGDVDLNDPITSPTVEISDGRAPRAGGEVLLSSDVADRFGVSVGDEIRFVRPDLDLVLVGIGRQASSYGSSIMVVTGFDRELFRSPDFVGVQTLVDLPDGVTDQQFDGLVRDFERSGVSAVDPAQWAYYDDGATTRDLAWGWVAGVVALVAVGIVIAAAFATSARRQLVTIGQLSANGAPERLVRRTMGLQGLWTGLFGALLGVFLALAGLLLAHRTGLGDRFFDHRVPSLTIVPLDMAVIVVTATAAAMIAALVPARSAARIPVLSALAGRRPVSTPPSWMAPVGVTSFVIGLFLLGGSTSVDQPGDFEAMLALIGALSVLAGIVCASPLIVAAVGNIGSRAGGVVRLAARSLGRSRTRSAAVLTAIATVGALATAGATVAPTATDDGYDPDLKELTLGFSNDVYAGAYASEVPITAERDTVYDPPPAIPTELPIDIRQGVERVLPDAEWIPITRTIDDPLPFRLETGETVFPEGFGAAGLPLVGSVTVVDPVVEGLLDLSPEQQQILDDTGVLGLTPFLDEIAIVSPSGPVIVELRSSIEALGFDGVPQTLEESDRAFKVVEARRRTLNDEIVVTPEFAAENDLATAVQVYVIDNPTDLTDVQRDALNDLQGGFGGQDAFAPEATAPGYETLSGIDVVDGGWWYPSFEWPNQQTPEALIQLAVIVASLLLVLSVVAIGLSLAATESRDERDVLHAVGASPKTLRRVSAAKAWVLTTGAAVVAVPAGYVTIFVITKAGDTRAPFPFFVAGALLVGIPLIAGGATLVVSAVAQRFRPATYATLAFE